MSRERLYPPDWCDSETASYMVSLSVDTFKRRVDDGTFPKPVCVGGKQLWHRARLSEALERLDPSSQDADDPIMRDLRGQTKTGGRRVAA